MPTDDTEVREEGLDALDALANEFRVLILRTLAEADEALCFSTLRRRVGIDDAGRFNYHLNRLRDQFVRKSAGGYELGSAGRQVVLATTPEARTDTAEPETTSDAACPVCGECDCEKLIHVHLDSR